MVSNVPQCTNVPIAMALVPKQMQVVLILGGSICISHLYFTELFVTNLLWCFDDFIQYLNALIHLLPAKL